MFYSAQTNGFYSPTIHGEKIPSDAIKIGTERYFELLEGQSAGKMISSDDTGEPVLRDRPIPVPEKGDVDIERDRRIYGAFLFQGKRYDGDKDSLSRITGAATLAGFAMGAGAEAGNFMWHQGEKPFVWIAADNTETEMDAPTMFAFGQAAANHQSRHIFAARLIKDMESIPLNYQADEHWPE